MLTEDGDDGAAQLGVELHARARAQQVRGLEVAEHVGRLLGRAEGEHAAREVEHLRVLGRVLAAGDAADDELGGVADGGHGRDVGAAGGLAADEGEDEGEDDGQDRHAHRLPVLQRQHEAGEEGAQHDEPRPLPPRDLLVRRRRVVDEVFLVDFDAAEASDQRLQHLHEREPQRAVVGAHFGEGAAEQEHRAGPGEQRFSFRGARVRVWGSFLPDQPVARTGSVDGIG